MNYILEILELLEECETKNHWIITKDHITEGKSVGVTDCYFPKGLNPKSLPVQFKLYDDDGELYYEGRMKEHDFHPLDHFGRPNAGCSYMMTREGRDKWEIL